LPPWNTYSAGHPTGHKAGPPDGLAALTAAVEELAAQNPARLPDAVLAERVLGLRRLLDRLEGQWLAELAAVDARGAAGADQGQPAPSTAAWLRNRLRLGAGAASGMVRTARALFGGPLTQTATALSDGELSAAHAAVLAHGTQELPTHTTAQAEPVLLEAARRLDPPRLRRVVAHLREVADPEGAASQADRQHQRRGLGLAPTLEGLVAIDGLLEPRPARPWWRPWNPWPARPTPKTSAAPANDTPTPSPELARRTLEGS
jgi:Domain of unknown function (DUF222)